MESKVMTQTVVAAERAAAREGHIQACLDEIKTALDDCTPAYQEAILERYRAEVLPAIREVIDAREDLFASLDSYTMHWPATMLRRLAKSLTEIRLKEMCGVSEDAEAQD